MDFSGLVFLSVLMFSFGYIAQNIRQFNFWKFLLVSILVIIFFNSFGLTKEHLLTMLVAFFVGYLLPHASILRSVGEHLSEFVNNIRYRDAYEDIKRKEEEVEELRKQYEKARAETNNKKTEQARRDRQEQSNNFRQNQKKDNQEQKQDSSNQSKQKTSSTYESPKAKYLKILGLDPNREYSFQEIKKAYRKQASKYHPDKHHGKPNYREMEERFKEVQDAFEKISRKI